VKTITIQWTAKKPFVIVVVSMPVNVNVAKAIIEQALKGE
jgi:hypothetical protein